MVSLLLNVRISEVPGPVWFGSSKSSSRGEKKYEIVPAFEIFKEKRREEKKIVSACRVSGTYFVSKSQAVPF